MRVFSYRHTEAGIRARAKLAGTITYQIEAKESKVAKSSLARAEKRAAEEARRQREFATLQAKLAELREWWARVSASGNFDGVSARDIAAGVGAKHGYTLAEITGKQQNKEIVAARFEAIKAVADARPDLSSTQIGKVFNRDHTSIIHALAKRGGRKIKG